MQGVQVLRAISVNGLAALALVACDREPLRETRQPLPSMKHEADMRPKQFGAPATATRANTTDPAASRVSPAAESAVAPPPPTSSSSPTSRAPQP